MFNRDSIPRDLGGTVAGLSLGSCLSELKAKVHAFCVCADPNFLYDYVQCLLDELHAGVNSHDIGHRSWLC
ncbi:unnamed protein product [Ilex paraguariensis]|uniref:Uncharacterized protein n=1 Tax=Ilex paraguariensis TaxID=185542 RepID=A0ABC8UZ60_9AQUA